MTDRHPHLDSVFGWLDAEAAQRTDQLLEYQQQHGLVGHLLEIGVYYGRYLILMGSHLMPREHLYGIDIFDSRPPSIPSATGNLRGLEENIVRYLPDVLATDRVHLIRADSREWAASECAESLAGKCRFVSIDGGHDAETTYSDLMLATKLLSPGGIVALDDWDRYDDWPGVMEGWMDYCVDTRLSWIPHRLRTLRTIGALPKKMLLTNEKSASSAYLSLW